MLLLDAVALRSAALRREAGSERTIKFYEFWLKNLSASLLIQDLDQVTLDDLRRWSDGLIQRKLAVRSRIGAVATAKAFFHWCLREELVMVDPSVRLEKPKKPKSLPQALEDYEIVVLANVAAGTFSPQRDVAIVVMFVETGVRLGELVSLKPDRVILPPGHTEGWIIVSGKTGERFAPLNALARRALEEWLVVRPAQMDTVFGLTGWGVRLMLKRLAKLASIDPKRIHPHVLRHTSAAQRVEGGGEATDLMNIFGWSSTAMFPVYARLAHGRMMRRAMLTSPTDRIFGQQSN